MSFVVSLCFAFLIYLPCALLLGGLMDLVWDRFVLGTLKAKKRPAKP